MSGDAYQRFLGVVPLNRIQTIIPTRLEWEYRDYGEKTSPALICFPPVSGTSDVFYKQLMDLGPKGYRLISVNYPAFFTFEEFCCAFESFLDALDLESVHLFGATLGAFLALIYVEYRPSRVKSLVLCNGFSSTEVFHENAPCYEMFRYMPGFMLKRLILQNYPDGVYPQRVTDSIDFMVLQLEQLDQARVASRLTLNCVLRSVDTLKIDPGLVTCIEALDNPSIPASLQERLSEVVQGCKVAHLKLGGSFPFLASPEEFNVHLQVHLRTIASLNPTATPGHEQPAAELDTCDYDQLYDEIERVDPERLSRAVTHAHGPISTLPPDVIATTAAAATPPVEGDE